jgi:hypothetical protein
MPKMKAQARALIERRMGHFLNTPSWGRQLHMYGKISLGAPTRTSRGALVTDLGVNKSQACAAMEPIERFCGNRVQGFSSTDAAALSLSLSLSLSRGAPTSLDPIPIQFRSNSYCSVFVKHGACCSSGKILGSLYCCISSFLVYRL